MYEDIDTCWLLSVEQIPNGKLYLMQEQNLFEILRRL